MDITNSMSNLEEKLTPAFFKLVKCIKKFRVDPKYTFGLLGSVTYNCLCSELFLLLQSAPIVGNWW